MFVLLEIHWSKLLQLELCAACLSLWPLCLCRPTWARSRRSWAQETVADLARPTRGGGTRIAAPHSRLWCSCGAAQSRVFAADKQWRVAPTHPRHQTHSAAQRKKCFGILIKIWQHTKVNITFCGRNRFPGKVSIYHLLPYPCPICYLRYAYSLHISSSRLSKIHKKNWLFVTNIFTIILIIIATDRSDCQSKSSKRVNRRNGAQATGWDSSSSALIHYSCIYFIIITIIISRVIIILTMIIITNQWSPPLLLFLWPWS